jgi:hypothetical protein
MTENHNDEICCMMKKKADIDKPPSTELNQNNIPKGESDGKKVLFGPAFDRAKHWYLGVVGDTLAHKQLSERCESRARYLNVTRVILNAIVSSAIFTSIGDTSTATDENRQYLLQVGAGSLSILVAILTAVSSTLDYEGRREAHCNAKRAFSKIKHQMEMLLFIKQTPLVIPSTNQPGKDFYQWEDSPKILFDMAPDWVNIVNDWEQVDADSPDVPQKLKKKLRNSQTSILSSLELLNPKAFAPIVVDKKESNDNEDEDEMY